MAIHHTLTKKATKFGIILQEIEGGGFDAHYPQYNMREQGDSAKDVFEAILAKIEQRKADEANFDGDPVYSQEQLESQTIDEQRAEDDARFHPEHIDDNQGIPDAPTVERSDKGIALDGAIAYAEGTLTADCPFNVESEDEEEQERANQWYEDWDAAADAKAEEEDKEPGGSVVSPKYRTRYAEAGHPTHCGDWLAELLIKLTTNDAGINLELFEEICRWNGVDTSKYKRSGTGWQGRIRMTGRNMLARRVFAAGQLQLTPELAGNDDGIVVAPADWMAAQRFKKAGA